jgi:hypothetical protein
MQRRKSVRVQSIRPHTQLGIGLLDRWLPASSRTA